MLGRLTTKFLPGDFVVVTHLSDGESNSKYLDQIGRVDCILDAGCGASPEDPLYGVEFDDGHEQYWTEELSPACELCCNDGLEAKNPKDCIVNEGEGRRCPVCNRVMHLMCGWNGVEESDVCGTCLETVGDDVVLDPAIKSILRRYWRSHIFAASQTRSVPSPLDSCGCAACAAVRDQFPDWVTEWQAEMRRKAMSNG